MTANEQLASVGKNIQEKATLIWNVANTLFGAFKPHEYGLVILPMVVIKRFHDCLLPTHQAVLDTYKKVEHLAVKEGFLRTAAGYQFYNTSPFTFETLRADPENINDNFRAYLNGFSDNVQDILSRMNFSAQIDRMEEAGLLYQVIVDFCSDKADMGPEKISSVDMGYIFENLVLDAIKDSDSKHYRHDDGFTDGIDDPFEDVWNDDSDDWDSSDDWSSSDDWGNSNDVFDGDGGFSGGGGGDDSW